MIVKYKCIRFRKPDANQSCDILKYEEGLQ